MKKNIMILINAANKLAHYHLALGKSLEKDGHKVIYVFDDHYSLVRDGLNIGNKNVFFFSDYFQEHFDNLPEIPERYTDINLSKCIFSDYDREIVHYHQKIPFDKYLEIWGKCLVLFFDKVINENEIDICINESVANAFSYTAFTVLKSLGKEYCGYLGSRLKNRFELYTEEFGSRDKFEIEFKKLMETKTLKEDPEIDEYLKSFKTSSVIPSYHPRGTLLDWNYPLIKVIRNQNMISYFKTKILYYKNYRKEIRFSNFKGHPIKNFIRLSSNRMKRLYRTRTLGKIFYKPKDEDEYFLYPLHLKPEASTSVLARHYCNDIAVIENIAFNLPPNTKLYVKEHFVNFGRLPKSFYESIKRLPNVRLLSPEENVKNLIFNSRGVITLTSTVGYEALLMNKPVWLFGNVFYECHPNCRKLKGFDDLFDSLRDYSISPNTDEINKRFVLAYKAISFEGNIAYLHYDKEFDDERFVNTMKKAIYEYYHL